MNKKTITKDKQIMNTYGTHVCIYMCITSVWMYIYTTLYLVIGFLCLCFVTISQASLIFDNLNT